MPKIALTNAVIIVTLLLVATVALVTDNKDVGNLIIGSVLGTVLGAGATVTVVQQSMAKRTDASDDPKPPASLP